MGRHDQHDRPRRRRLVRAAVWLAVSAVVLLGLNAAASAFIGTGQRPKLGPPGTVPTASSAANRPTSAGPAPHLTMAFTGDMLLGDEALAQARRNAGTAGGYDLGPMLAKVAPIISAADLAICHQETPVSDNDRGVRGYPSFNAPYELAAAEKSAGYDACDTASNHAADLGAGGITATLSTLDKYGLRHTGTARSQAEAEQDTIYTVGGVKVGHLAYTYGLNGVKLPQPWMANVIDIGAIKARAHALKQAGADIVVVSVHAGTEQVQAPSADQVRIDDEIMTSPDVDLVVGAHAHVVQPVKKLADGRWIVYGLGNFLAQQTTGVSKAQPNPPNRDGVIIEPTFTRGSEGRYRITQMGYVATYVNAPSDVVEPAPGFSKQRTVKSLTAMHAPLTDLSPT